jgi:hypothetical protein
MDLYADSLIVAVSSTLSHADERAFGGPFWASITVFSCSGESRGWSNPLRIVNYLFSLPFEGQASTDRPWRSAAKLGWSRGAPNK